MDYTMIKSKKNILIVNYYYSPINNGAIQRMVNFKKYLEKYGFNVFVLTTNSYGICSDDVKNGVYRFSDIGYDYIQSNSICKISKFLFRAIRRILLYLGFILDGKFYWKINVLNSLDRLFENKKFDCVIASYPTPVNLELGEIIHKKYH